MDAMPHERARAKQAVPVIDRGVARVVREQALDRRDLAEVFIEMRLHQHGGKFFKQGAQGRELLIGRGNSEARRYGVTLAPGTMPAAGECAAAGDGTARGVEESRGVNA